MKKSTVLRSAFIVGLLFLLPAISCIQNSDPVTITPTSVEVSASLGKYNYGRVDEFFVVVIDSCEYIAINSKANLEANITHKGNCKFCAKRK